LQISNCKFQIANFKLQISNRNLQFAIRYLPFAICHLLFAICYLPFVYGRLLMPANQVVLTVVFAIFTLMTLGGGLGVVSSRNLFHSAMFLMLSLAGVVGYYVLLDAGFLAAVQLLIYIGAIAILILFAIMLSRGLMAERQSQRNEQWWIALLVAVLTFVVLAVVLWQVDWPVADESALTSPTVAISRLGQELLGPYVIPFEVASVLLLAALVGAVILARETES